MTSYVLRRLLMMIPVLFIGSVIVFVIIQLPPGNVIDAKIALMRNRGVDITPELIASLNAQYDLDKPIMVQYFYWFETSCAATSATRCCTTSRSA